MAIFTYDLLNVKRDLSDVLSTIIAGQPRFISLFQPVADATNQKHEWLENQILGRSVTAVSVSSLAVTMSEADVAKLAVGVLLVPKNDTALFRVASISGTTVTVALAAANGSSKTAPANGDILNIVSRPVVEGSTEGEQGYFATGSNYNYTQIFRRDIVITGSSLAQNVYGGVDNNINAQTRFALDQLARDLNRAALYGRRVQPVSGTNGEFGGLYAFGTGTGSLSVNANGATLDSYVINDGSQASIGAGGNPSVILCAPGQARVISNEYKDRIQVVRGDMERGTYVARIVNELSGQLMTVMGDPDMPDGEAWVIDPAGFGLSNLQGRALMDEDTTTKGFDGIRRTALGEMTLELKNPHQRLCRLYGLKASATAIAEYKAGSKTVNINGDVSASGDVTATGDVTAGDVTATGTLVRNVTVTADAQVPTADNANFGYIVTIGTGWTGGTNITTAVAGEQWRSTGAAWVKITA